MGNNWKANARKEAKTKALVNHIPGDTSGLNSDNASHLIRKRAYELFEIRGRGSGRELEDWLQAEAEINRDLRNTPGAELTQGIRPQSQ